MTTTQNAAIAQIDMVLREEAGHYTFDTLRDRFEKGLADARAYGDEYVCVKIPSHYEVSFTVATVVAALGGK